MADTTQRNDRIICLYCGNQYATYSYRRHCHSKHPAEIANDAQWYRDYELMRRRAGLPAKPSYYGATLIADPTSHPDMAQSQTAE